MFASAFNRSGLLLALIGAAIVTAGCGSDQANDTDGSTATNSDTVARTRPGQAGAAQSGAERPVDAESLAYAEVNEELVYGYFAFPSDMIEPLPAIVIIHDWWGLNEDTRNAASRLAAEGYMVLAVDLYGGETADSIESARSKMISVIEKANEIEANLRQALTFVGVAGAPKKAMLGWGFGGSWSLSATMLFPEQLNAAVIFYGQVNNDEDSLRAIQAPILGLFGGKDRGIKLATVRGFETAMQHLRKNLTLQVYPDVGHAFADPARNNFKADIAEDAWRRTVEFLAANLSSAEET